METVLRKSGCKECPDGLIESGGMEKILITGASGYLGRKLFDRLEGNRIDKGRFVRPMSRSWTKKDVTNKEDVDSEMRQVAGGYVYHLAGKVSFNKRDSKEVMETTIQGTKNILEAACRYKIKKVVIVSSACTVGTANNPYFTLKEDSRERDTTNAYVYAKMMQEQIALSCPCQPVIVAPTTCYAPLMAGLVIPSGGTNVLDPHDAVEGMIYAMAHGRKGQKYILGGYNVSYRELYRMAGRRFVVCPRWLRKPLMWLAKFDSSWYMSPYTMDSSFRFKYFNCEKARKELGWEPITKLETIAKQR